MNPSATWSLPVFVVGATSVTVGDVIDAANFRGELAPCMVRLLAGLAGEEGASDFEAPDESELQSCSEEFRSARDLITAEETEGWLAARGLSVEDFTEYFVRRYRRDRRSTDYHPAAMSYDAAPDAVRDLLRVELLLDGDFDRLAEQLAWRLLARDRSGKHGGAELVVSERRLFFERVGLDEAAIPAWLARIGRDSPWLDGMIEAEAAFRRERMELMTPDAMERALGSLRLLLVRLEVEMIELDTIEAAREALLCVRDDGVPMQQVAREGRYPCRCVRVLSEELPEAVRLKLLSARAGDVLDPIESGGSFLLCRLLAKSEPDFADPGVRARVETAIIEGHFSALAAERVTWIVLPGRIE